MEWQNRHNFWVILSLFALGISGFILGETDTIWATEPKRGGIIRVGNIGEPPTLDAHWTTATITEVTSNHYAEGLYTLDANYQPIPMLAESHTVSEDGKVWVFKLRPGILFHNGKEMTSEDVVASLNRWGQMSTYGKTLYTQVEEVKALDKYTVQMNLKEPSGIVLISLGTRNNFGAIYPKELIEQYGTERLKEYIGTGPFKVEEWRPDRYIKMTRWDKYTPRSEPANGFGGQKVAYVDEVRFIPIPDVSVRVASVETGEIDFADDINPDAYERVKDNPQLEVIIAKPYYWIVAVLNKKKGLFTNRKMRQAFQAAINIEPIMKAAGGNPQFYRLDSSLAFQEQAQWWIEDAGKGFYNVHDKEKAKQLLKEAGYQGEAFRFMTTQEYDWMYKAALVTKQQLEEIGITVDLQVVDWSTLVQRRNNPDLYDAFTTGMGMFYDPTHTIYLKCSWPGWTCEEEFDRLLGQMMVEQDYKKRLALWKEVNQAFYEKVPVIRYGDLFGLRIMQKHLKNVQRLIRPFFWNVWIEK